MNWTLPHERSEQLASRAHESARKGERAEALELFSQAAFAETAALEEVENSKPRTRGILAVSATALWLKAERFAAAEKVAIAALSREGSLPDFAVAQLRELLQEVWTTISMHESGITFLPGQVTISVQGGQIVSGGAPLDLIVSKVQTVQAFFYRTIEYVTGIEYRRRGAPSIDIQEACPPWLLQRAPGSYQFAVAVQEPSQKDFFKEMPEATEVARHFTHILKASTEGNEALSEVVSSEEYRSAFLKLTRNLAPTGKTFSRLEVRGPGYAGPISLEPEDRKAINGTIRNTERKPPEPETIQELVGILRAVHLDRDWIELIVDKRTLHIDGVTEAIDDLIGPMVNRPVLVRAIHLGHDKYRFRDIESGD